MGTFRSDVGDEKQLRTDLKWIEVDEEGSDRLMA